MVRGVWRTGFVIGLAATCIVLLACAPAAESPGAAQKPSQPAAPAQKASKVLKIGAPVGITGPLAAEGAKLRKGYEVWRDVVNEKGGVQIGGDTYTIELVFYDDQSDPATNAKLTEKLITEDKVQFILGPYSSPINFAGSAIAAKYGAVMITTGGNADNIFERGFKTVFATLAPASYIAWSFLEMSAQLDPKPKTVAFLVKEDIFGKTVAGGARAKAKEMGFQELGFEIYPADAKDFSVPITKLKAANPDLVLNHGHTEDGIIIYKQMMDLKWKPPAIYWSTPIQTDPKVLESFGRDLEGTFASLTWHSALRYKDPVFGSTQAFVEQFQRRVGRPPEFSDANGAGAGVLLQVGLQQAGTLDPAKVADAIRAWEGETLYAIMKHDANGKNIGFRTGVLQVQDNKVRLVWPGAAQETKPLWPTPALR